MTRKFPVVIVEWIDASYYSMPKEISWLQSSVEVRTMANTTVGFLIRKDRQQVVLTSEITQNTDEGRGTSVIPVKYIKKIIYLKEME